MLLFGSNIPSLSLSYSHDRTQKAVYGNLKKNRTSESTGKLLLNVPRDFPLLENFYRGWVTADIPIDSMCVYF